jgi:tripeptidyl-peptidase-1
MHLLISQYVLIAAFLHLGTVLSSSIRSRTPYVVKDRHHVPRQWTNVGRAPRGHMVHLQIGLKQESFDELEKHLYEGSVT